MKKARELINLMVVDEKGRQIGRVSEICLGDGTAVRGIQVERGGILGTKDWISFCDVKLIGEHSVIIRQKPHKRKYKALMQTGQRILSTDGRRLGRLTDVLIDENKGTIEALEISKGYIDDVREGRQWVNRFTLDSKTGTVIAALNGHEREV